MLEPFLKNNADEEEKRINDLISEMKETSANPGIRNICSRDPLIREFTSSLLDRLGEEDIRRRKDNTNARQKVRTLGRFLSFLNTEAEGIWKPLSFFLSPSKFKFVANCVRKMTKEVDSPQLALVLGHYIRQTNLLKISMGVIQGSEQMQQEGRAFGDFFQAKWNNSVASVALKRQKIRQINQVQKLPTTTDSIRLKLVKEWMSSKIKCCMEKQQLTTEELKWMSQLVMTRIIIFNKRRVSEVEELKVSRLFCKKE
jgi:hypothetical protein